jgi:anaerobic selenocysteine-containing dehydrogenase
MQIHASTCPLDCPDRCSLTVEVSGDRVTRIDGDRRNPLTDGFICGKVRRFPDRVHGEGRILHPMRRVGDRFARVSWDEALAEIGDRWRTLRATIGAESLLPYWYGGSNGWLTGGGLDQRLWNRLGTTQIVRTLCAANARAGASAVYGDLPSADLADVDDAAQVVLWGCNPSASGIHLVPKLRAAAARGGLVVVDPRETPLTRQAALHLRPLPGTDVAVALAVAHEALRRGWADRDFLAAHATDLPAFEAAVEPWTPERAHAVSAVPPDQIRALAERYAGIRPTLLRCGWGLERTRNGTDAIRAVLALPALFGQFGVRGAGWAFSTSAGYRMDASRWQGPSRGRRVNMADLGQVLDDARDPPIASVFVYNCNPVATLPDQRRVVDALSHPDRFVIVHEQVWTDTCAVADLVLPATTFLEHDELVRSYAGYVVQWSPAAIPPVGEAWSNHRLIQALARELGHGDEPAFRIGPADLAAEIADQLPPGAWDTLQRDRVLPLPRPVQYRDVHAPIRLCGDAPPTYRPPPFAADLPFALLSPATTRAISSTGYETLPAGTAVVDIHPDDAARRGVTDGATVRLFNPLGEVVVRAAVTTTVPPGVISLPKGLWRSATANGWTSNALVPAHVDPLGGGACYNDARVDLEVIP